MNSGRFAWLLCLCLAVLVTLVGQTRTPDACEADESDRSISAVDDSMVAAVVTVPDEPAQLPGRFLRFDCPPPSDRMAVSDVFRPPNRPRH